MKYNMAVVGGCGASVEFLGKGRVEELLIFHDRKWIDNIYIKNKELAV